MRHEAGHGTPCHFDRVKVRLAQAAIIFFRLRHVGRTAGHDAFLPGYQPVVLDLMIFIEIEYCSFDLIAMSRSQREARGFHG
jgi:hypothetical protein